MPSNNTICSIPGCSAPYSTRGWCRPHYGRWRRTGSPIFPDVLTPEERFWSKVDKNGAHGCWLWLTGQDAGGYGQFHFNRASLKAHRYAYELLVGPIPEALTLDHLCRVRHCVKPAHLEPVTSAENIRRGFSPPALSARQTHCIHGHLFDTLNTYIRPDNGGRMCRICTFNRQKQYRDTINLEITRRLGVQA